jgi:ribosomal-protein-alanine N-acetyltransferase
MGGRLAPLRPARLEVVPCTLAVARAAVGERSRLASLLAAQVPDDWPAEDLQVVLPFYAQQLELDPLLLGWGIWVAVDLERRVLVGDAGFKGPPDANGAVEVGYSVLPAFRDRGYATEAVRALLDWALAQSGVRRVVAECASRNLPSARVLTKLGMRRAAVEGDTVLWELEEGT